MTSLSEPRRVEAVAARRLTVLQRVALVAGVVLALAFIGFALRHSTYPLLPPDGEGRWITFPYPIVANTLLTAHRDPPPYVFTHTFEWTSPTDDVELVGRALREWELELNGEPVELGPAPSVWRHARRIDLSGRLRQGENRVRVSVRNATGPPVLQLAILSPAAVVLSDGAWRVARAGAPARAVRLAEETLRHPGSQRTQTVAEVMRARAVWIGLLFMTGVGAAVLVGRVPSWSAHPYAPFGIAGGLGVLYLAAFARTAPDLPLKVGFDSLQHVEYVEFLLRERRLPLATDGWSMFHPPLYHLLQAGVCWTLDAAAGQPGARTAYRLVGLLAALANLGFVAWVGRRLFPHDALRAALTVLAAGVLPAHLYMTPYVSNELLASACGSAAIALTVVILLAREPRLGTYAALALALGAGLLAKFTLLVVAVPSLAAVVGKHLLLGRRPFREALVVGGGLVAGVALLAAPFYVRNWLAFGTPIVFNFEFTDGYFWWHLPGAHGLRYFLSFGEALSHPYHASFASFWDGLYSTLWGDGMLGSALAADLSGQWWNHEWMTVGYGLALPATLLLGVGLVRAGALALRGEDVRRRLAFSYLLLVMLAMFSSLLAWTAKYASYAAPKAFYGLPVLAAFAVLAALGLSAPSEALSRRGRWLAWIYWGWAGCLASVFLLAVLL